jgi:hypothetical protein
MAKASWTQLQELGLRIRRGQIPLWKIPAVFGIVEEDALGKYLRFVEEARKEIISSEQVQALIEGKDERLNIFKVTVDYGLTPEQMIAAGRYDSVDGVITSAHFPVQGEGKVEREFVLVHFNEVMTTDEVLSELDRRGLRPAKIEELLALGATRPDLQREFLLEALGSSFKDDIGVHSYPCLYGLGVDRGLGLDYDVNGLDEFSRFLAVRKSA